MKSRVGRERRGIGGNLRQDEALNHEMIIKKILNIQDYYVRVVKSSYDGKYDEMRMRWRMGEKKGGGLDS